MVEFKTKAKYYFSTDCFLYICKMARLILEVEGLNISIEKVRDEDYVSLTDIAKQSKVQKPAYTILNWLRTQSTLLYLETWEKVHNPDFKVVQMHNFRLAANDNRANVSPKSYIKATNAIGIISKAGRYGGTLAHSDIALEFCTWLSPAFKVYLYKEFKKLKAQEFQRQSLEWHISKITDNVEEIRNLLDTIPYQAKARNRLTQQDSPNKPSD